MTSSQLAVIPVFMHFGIQKLLVLGVYCVASLFWAYVGYTTALLVI